MEFDPTKPFKTRDGRSVENFNMRAGYPRGSVGGVGPMAWRHNGWVYPNWQNDLDLVNTPLDTVHTIDGKPLASGNGESDAAFVEQCWQTILDFDDRNSPEEYPDHVLIDFGEFQRFMEKALARRAASPDAGGEVTEAMVNAAIRAFNCGYGGIEASNMRCALRAALAAREPRP